LLVEKANAAGGIKGRKLELVEYDDGGEAPKAKTFALRLITQDNVDVIIGGSITGTTMAAVPTVEENDVPFISLAGASVVVNPVKKWVFKIPGTDSIAAQQCFVHMKSKGITKIAMLNGSDGYGQSGRVQATKIGAEMGMTILADETYAPTDTDMTSQLTRIKGAAGVQAILNYGIGAGPTIIARNVRQLGITVPLYLSPAVGSRAFIDNTGEPAEGVLIPVVALFVANQLPANDPQRAVSLAFKELYESRYKEEASYGASMAYDGFMIATEAMKRAATIDRASIRDQIEVTKKYVGINGIVNMTPADHMGLDQKAFIIAQVKNKDWTLAQ
ncbi:MAG: ABC transporter substrate-binding protein, partial [Beijerinckiaceae bacterium]|nr:ABC transporter substrate-binding protein [Beijerinckiaceae bacterium]